MSTKTPRFEAMLVTGFTNIYGVFDHQNSRFRNKDDGPGPHRVTKEVAAISMATTLNLEHEAAQKKANDAAFEAAAPKAPRAKRNKAEPVPAAPVEPPKAEEPVKKTRAKRTPPKIVETPAKRAAIPATVMQFEKPKRQRRAA